jgi:hypothetical protein
MGETLRGAAGLCSTRGGAAEGVETLKSAARAKEPTGDLLGRLLSLQGVVAFWAVYGVAHALLRLSITRTLTLDDSRASELVQTLSLGYQLRQPPLYEWLLWFSQQAFGSGIESHLVVRYSLIALLGIATYGAVRAAVKDDRWAAAASFSLVFSYPVGWTFHEWATQTILLSIACMVTMHAAIRFFEAPSARVASLLGLAIALGLYAKFSYPLFLGGLLAAALSIEETRRRLLDVRLLISLVIAAIAISPYVYWIVQVRGDVVADLSSHLIKSERPHLERAAIGLWRLVSSLPIFLLPWLLFVALLAPKALLPGPANTAAPSLAERLALRTMLFAAVIAAVGIAASGATNIAERYMHPILIIAPIYGFARIVRLAADEMVLRRFAVFALGAAATILVARFVAATDNPLTRGMGRGLLMPYAELVSALKARGIVDGTVASPRVREAGNLRAFEPTLRVVARESQRAVPPPRRASDERSCVLIWTRGQDEDARRMAGQALSAERIEIPAQRYRLIATPASVWSFARLDPKSPVCR